MQKRSLGHWLIDSEGNEKYYLICENIKEPGIPLAEVLQLYSEKSSPNTWKNLLKFPENTYQ
jgi:hypothetical protein